MSEAALIEPHTARRPPTQRRVALLVVGSLAVVAATALVMHLMGFDGWDTPAHLYKIAALRRVRCSGTTSGTAAPIRS